MIEAQKLLRAEIECAERSDPQAEQNLAACELAQQILNLHAVYQTQPLQTHEIPALPQ